MKKSYKNPEFSSRGKHLTHAEFLKRIESTGIIPLEEYSRSLDKMKFKCFCGNEFTTSASRIFNGTTKSCGCIKGKLISEAQWNGLEEMSGHYLYNVKQNATTRGLDFSITPQYMWDIFIKQNRKCRYSGRELFFARSRGKSEQTASLDRIDSDHGYVENNIQWIHKDINQMKWNMSQRDFLYLCFEISDNLRID